MAKKTTWLIEDSEQRRFLYENEKGQIPDDWGESTIDILIKK